MSEGDFWSLGCEITKHKVSGNYGVGLRRFRSLFGTTPAICCLIWNRLALHHGHPLGSLPEHLLYALLLLKVYPTESQMKAMTGKDEKTLRKWAWIYIDLMAFHLRTIVFDARLRNANVGQTCFVSLDATDCPIQKPAPFYAAWYSHKLNGPGMKYEIGLCINTGHIVWVNGGVPCGAWSDLKLARAEYVLRVQHNELTIADDTYKDATYFIYPSGNPESALAQKSIMAVTKLSINV